jgi:hypothetical protein
MIDIANANCQIIIKDHLWKRNEIWSYTYANHKLCFITEQNNWMKIITKQNAILIVQIFEWQMTIFFETSDLLRHNL